MECNVWFGEWLLPNCALFEGNVSPSSALSLHVLSLVLPAPSRPACASWQLAVSLSLTMSRYRFQNAMTGWREPQLLQLLQSNVCVAWCCCASIASRTEELSVRSWSVTLQNYKIHSAYRSEKAIFNFGIIIALFQQTLNGDHSFFKEIILFINKMANYI